MGKKLFTKMKKSILINTKKYSKDKLTDFLPRLKVFDKSNMITKFKIYL